MPSLRVFTPTEWARAFPDPSIDFFHKFLMQGDSWFSIGALPPAALTTNMPSNMSFTSSACAVNFAQPGAELAQLVNVAPTSKWVFNPAFEAALHGRLCERWDALLLSAGGNDLIAALNTPPQDESGQPVPLAMRLLRLASEWGPQSDPSRFVSDEGWSTFEAHLDAVFDVLVGWRDASDSKSRFVPIVIHSYCRAQPRLAGTGGVPGHWLAGPWLARALQTYDIPDADGTWHALSAHLIDRLFTLLTKICGRFPHVFLADMRGALRDASADATGVDGDWVNEIHPTDGGYQVLARVYCAVVEQALLTVQAPPLVLPASPRMAARRPRRVPATSPSPVTRGAST
ncbi:hypothetical protein FOB72_24755 [Cupriavidus pauculus]|uniref:SGNH hydrolase-type esterase domain-containing protein n=1 Tax=Cupriavidus pauculus TaxID=82633 RepID=A0A5P2HAY5_9BURK|nr:hypothetical protein [Cupriavidus pauculus]QET05242.1 hypothetical protein FOB72_24755 [Cupriavidus pauculus]